MSFHLPIKWGMKYEVRFVRERMDPKQKEIYQSMTPEEKLNVALRLYHSARQLKMAVLHHDHPDWTEKEIQEKVREIFLYART
jgi:hypothetical protein